MQEEGHLTAIIRPQIVFVGLLKPDCYNVTLQDKGERKTAFRTSARCFDAFPHGRLLRSPICCKKLLHVQICVLKTT